MFEKAHRPCQFCHMENALSRIAFVGASLDRSAHLRGKTDDLHSLAASDGGRFLVLWRGRPLVCGAQKHRLALLPEGHPVLKDAELPPIFLGMSEGKAYFACELSKWVPDTLGEEATGIFDLNEYSHPDLPPDHLFCDLRAVMTRLSPLDAELAATAKSLLVWHASHRFCSACGAESQSIQSGWQRKCPTCGAMHFPRTDLVVIMLVTLGNSVLLGRSPGWPEGMYSLLAGFMEPGETIEAAIRREVFEETGVKIGDVGLMASQPWPYPSSLMIGCRAEALSHEITLDPVELENALWVSRETLVDVFAGRHPVIRPSRRGSIAHALLLDWLADRSD
jgi:NAD+ diphosphatase